jgi:uncharacterized membrane protein
MTDELIPLRRAKRPATVLAGPYGHPFHALLVTIPIGSWVAAFVFDIVALASDDPEPFARGAALLIGIGLIGAVLAAVVGFLDLSRLASGTKARRIALTHMAINLTVTVLFAVSLLVRVGGDLDEVSVAGFVIAILALLLLGMSGFLGGELAYRYGVRVADEETQQTGFGS